METNKYTQKNTLSVSTGLVVSLPVSLSLFLSLVFQCVCAAINRPDILDTDMEAIMDTMVDSLFCFFVTLGEAWPLSGALWVMLPG